MLPHTRQSGETMTSVSAGHIILKPTKAVGSGRSQRESYPGPPDLESRALPIDILSYRAPESCEMIKVNDSCGIVLYRLSYRAPESCEMIKVNDSCGIVLYRLSYRAPESCEMIKVNDSCGIVLYRLSYRAPRIM